MENRSEQSNHIEGLARAVAELTAPQTARFAAEVEKCRQRVRNAVASEQVEKAAAGGTYGNVFASAGEAYDRAPVSLASRLNVFATEELSLDNVEECMRYKAYDRDQEEAATQVREALTAAIKAVLRNVPRCPFRSVGLRKLVEARMDFNGAIAHRGRF